MTTSMKSAHILIFATLLYLVVSALPAVTLAFDAAQDFSTGSNPNGAWSYGYSYGVGSAFILDTTNTASYGPGLALSGWMGNVNSTPGANYPYALKNFTTHPVANNITTVYQPGQLGLHPDESNVVSIVRWTAPSSGAFSISARFSSLDAGGASTDVHVLHNGSSLFDSVVSPSATSYSGLQNIIAGDTIDFVVGNGGNGINDDTTGLSATISAAGTFRTTAAIGAVFQVPNPIATDTDLLAFDAFAGHDLVDLALGQALTTAQTNHVLALEINCDSTSARLVVFDTVLLSNIVDVAGSTDIHALTGQDNPAAAGPNHERFVMRMAVNTNGFLVGGFLTVSGRVFLDPTNGCPRAVLVDSDRTHDRGFGDAAVKNQDGDSKVKDKNIAGEAHLIGIANVIFGDGSTNVTLLPFGQLTMRRQLLP